MAVRKEVWLIFRTMHKDFQKGLKQVRNGVINTQRQIDRMRKPMKKLGATMGFQARQFQMWALGIMFFGMQIMRTFTRIAKSSFETFNKVMGESLTTAREAMMGLTASTEMLKFSIGSAMASALEPIVPALIDIIDRIGDWVQQNEWLTTALVLGGVVLGAFLFIGGQLVLFLSSLTQLWLTWGIAIKGIARFFAPVIAIISGLIDIMFNWGKSTKKVVGGIVKIMLGIGAAFAIAAGAPLLLVTAIVAAGLLIINTVVKHWDVISEFFSNLVEKPLQWGKDLISNFWEGIKSMASWFKEKISTAFQWVKDIFSFDDVVNDLMAQKWGSDMVKNFAIGSSQGPGGQQDGGSSAAPNSTVINIRIDGSVMGDDRFLKRLGDTVASSMRKQGNQATIF